MRFSLPIYVEQTDARDGHPPAFVARPLFASEPVQRADKLGRALARLGNDLHRLLRGLGEQSRHDELAAWTFDPPLEESTVDLRLELGSGSQRRRFFLVGYPALGRKLWFTPHLPHLVFEVWPAQSLPDRATAVLTRHLRDLEKAGTPFDLDTLAPRARGRLTLLEIELELPPAAANRQPARSSRAQLFGNGEPKSGDAELRQTGRSLQSLYPDDLGHALGREREVGELARLLASPDRRPVVLVGPRQVGKTAILHDLVRRICEGAAERYAGRREIWHLSPMRLVSGMSVVGEWENRVVAILDHARERDLVLYFDDLLGLFAAGVSSASDAHVAQVLAPVLERRKVRVIAEITPEAWRVLRERDRAFADLFHVIPVPEPSESETLRILVHLARRLEEDHRCTFELDVVPTAYELLRRHSDDAAFPGKAARFLRQLATRQAGKSVNREAALAEFRARSGLDLEILDERRTLARPDILARLRRDVVGQDHVLEAFADVLIRFKARLADPRRPLAAFLLLGPTGVGKTQSAKALARCLFGTAERLLRFDMNEYVDPASVARLTGTPREPEGLLTGAVRRQPFGVLLFDEIEKAAPEAFDLLLAVLDEGRLTDSLGRVADFTQSVILLTSNLGVRESSSRLGFGADAGGDSSDAVFVGAAEQFFRPEFFNRLDRVVPFRPLAPDQLRSITRQLLAELLGRDGLRRRRVIFEVTRPAFDRLVELGHHPQLGARALKRVVEREVAQLLATRLAARPVDRPLLANLDFAAATGRFDLRLRDLRPVDPATTWPDQVTERLQAPDRAAWTEGLRRAVPAALRRLGAQLDAGAPAGAVQLAEWSPEQAWYFLGREQVRKVEERLGASETPGTRARAGRRAPPLSHARPLKLVRHRDLGGGARVDRRRQADAIQIALSELAELGEPNPASEWIEVPDLPLLELLRELALLEAIASRPVDDRALVVYFDAGPRPPDTTALEALVTAYLQAFHRMAGFGCEIDAAPSPSEAAPAPEERPDPATAQAEIPTGFVLHLTGPNVSRLLPEGTHAVLVRNGDDSSQVLWMHVFPAGQPEEDQRRIRELGLPASDRAAAGASEVVPLLHQIDLRSARWFLDFRSGLALEYSKDFADFRTLLLSALPLPPELEACLEAAPPAPAAPHAASP